MLHFSTDFLLKAVNDERYSRELKSCFLEVFTLHFRNLYDFLYDRKPKPDSVISSEFFPDPMIWRNKRRQIKSMKSLDGARKRTNTEVSHLSWDRLDVTEEKKDWRFEEIFNSLNQILIEFIAVVPKQHLHDDWKKTSVGRRLLKAASNANK